MTELAVGNSIVVGVDGSEASMEALRWAARQAHALHADVGAVHAWEPIGPRFAPYAPASACPTAAEQQERAAHLLASTLREVFGPRIDSAVHAVVVEGPPARVLLRQAPVRPAHDRCGGTRVPAACDAPRGHGAASQRPASPLVAVGAPSTAKGGTARQTTDDRALHQGFGHAVIAGRPPSRPARRDRETSR
ncbi:universal stress protein [Streptomyces sp. NPDC001435]|uniref:universal stress protein n=1 Tax=unclassified Streptomyces TaxID=2593676 RepID=UPI003678E413